MTNGQVLFILGNAWLISSLFVDGGIARVSVAILGWTLLTLALLIKK